MNHNDCGPDCTPGLHCPACHGADVPHRGQHTQAGQALVAEVVRRLRALSRH